MVVPLMLRAEGSAAPAAPGTPSLAQGGPAPGSYTAPATSTATGRSTRGRERVVMCAATAVVAGAVAAVLRRRP